MTAQLLLQEATKAIKPLLGKYYTYDDTPIAVALWRCFGSCNIVGAEKANKGVMWFIR